MTAYFGTLGGSPSSAIQNHTGDITVVSTFALTAALALNDTITMLYVPDNAVITGLRLSTDTALDTNATSTLAFDVGDSGSANRFIAALAQGNDVAIPITSLQSSALGYQYTTSGAETLNAIIVKVHTAPATGATTGTLRLAVTYTMQMPNPSATAASDT